MFELLQTSSPFVALITLVAGLYAIKKVFASRDKCSFAPGPPRWPILGNALQIPQVRPWLTFSSWKKLYGDVIHLDVVGQPMIIINSAQIAQDLLDKRSSTYSNRPHLVMAGELCGFNLGFVLRPYGDVWRKQRKIIAGDFSQVTVPRYYPLQETEARKLVRSVLDDNDSLTRQIKLKIGTIIMRVTYGHYVTKEDDPTLKVTLDAMDNFTKASAAGAWPVDFIPQLKNLPEWMPGAGFLKTAKEWRKVTMAAGWNPYLLSKANTKSGTALMPNLCSTAITEADDPLSPAEEDLLVWAAAAVMGGGLDTNMSTVLTFFLVMTLHPEIQAKARAEIDSVIGLDRLPSISDKPSLPYCRSLITELYRWAPAVPLCIPHSVTKDDVYNGMFIPKNSLIMPNIWHMLHDPEVFADPLSFNPDRYGNSDAEMRKVTDLAFGFGRRSCPGFHFAEGTIFAIVATTLATCEVVPAVDAQGKDIIPDVGYTTGTIVFPEPFKCTLRSRSPQAATMLAQTSIVPE